MKAQYYTPTIEEFHIGFEFEMTDTQEKVVFTTNCPYPIEIIEDFIIRKLVRVKHLDREDIESFGFVVKSDYGAGTSFMLGETYQLDTVKTQGITYSEFNVRIFELGIMKYVGVLFVGDMKICEKFGHPTREKAIIAQSILNQKYDKGNNKRIIIQRAYKCDVC